jgi:hypothetical protein
MLRPTTLLLLMFVSGAASADVLDHHSSLLARLMHQLFAPHHLPFTVLVLVVGIIALQRWHTARK